MNRHRITSGKFLGMTLALSTFGMTMWGADGEGGGDNLADSSVGRQETTLADPAWNARFDAHEVAIRLGRLDEVVTLVRGEDGRFRLGDEPVHSGVTRVSAANGNEYVLRITTDEGGALIWTASYQPRMINLLLGQSGDTVLLEQAEDGGYWLDGRAVTSGETTAHAGNGNTYTLRMGEDGMWMAEYREMVVEVMLGTSGGTVAVSKSEDGGYWLGELEVESGVTVATASNGNRYRLMKDADGMWMAEYVPETGTVTVGSLGVTLETVQAEDGSWTVVSPLTGERETLEDGATFMVGGNTYTLAGDGAGNWMATYREAMVTVMLGMSGETVLLTKREDGSYWMGEMQVEDGVTMVTATNGNMYTLRMGADGMWMTQHDAPQTQVALGTSGTTVTLVREEDGTYTLDGEMFRSGGEVTAGNGNVYTVTMVDGAWMVEYQPESLEIEGTGGLTAVSREDGEGYDVDGALLPGSGMGDIETTTSGSYRVRMEDGMLVGMRLDTVKIDGQAKFKTSGLSVHPSIRGDDKSTAEINEANTALVVAGENYSFADLLGDGVSQTEGKNFVADARTKLAGIREKIVQILEVFDTDSQRDTQIGRQWGTDSTARNNAKANVKNVLQSVFGNTKFTGLVRPDDDRALAAIDDLIKALSSADELAAALGEDGVLKDAGAEADEAGTIFAATETASTVTYGLGRNTRFGTVARTKRSDAVSEAQYDFSEKTGERGAFGFGVTDETTRMWHVQTEAGTARYRGGTLALSGAGEHYEGDIEVAVNFRSRKVDGLITNLTTAEGEPWEYLFGAVDSIVLPKADMNWQGIWKQVSGDDRNEASIGFGSRAGAYRAQNVVSTFEGRLLGGNSAPDAGSEVVGVWSLGSDTESKSYLAGGFGAQRIADDMRLPGSNGRFARMQVVYPIPVQPGVLGGTQFDGGKATVVAYKWDWVPSDGDMFYGPDPKSGTGLPVVGSKTMTINFEMEPLLAAGTEERLAAVGTRHIHNAKTAIEKARNKLGALIDLELPEAEQAKQWKAVQNTVRSILFSDGSEDALADTRLGGAYAEGTSLALIDEVLAGLDSQDALKEALGEGGIFTYSSDPDGAKAAGDPLTDKSVRDLWNEPKWELLAALDHTTYTGFGVWRLRFSKNAERNGGWQGEAVTSRSVFSYSQLDASQPASWDAPEAPSKGTVTYLGKTVAYFSNPDSRTGRAPGVVNEPLTLYTGNIEVRVAWNPVSDGNFGKMSFSITDLMTAEGKYFRHDDGAAGDGREVRSIEFAGIGVGLLNSDLAFPEPFVDPVVHIHYQDSSQTPYRAPSSPVTFSQGFFQGSTPDYPLTVAGVWNVHIQEEGVSGTGTFDGGFGAEVP